MTNDQSPSALQCTCALCPKPLTLTTRPPGFKWLGNVAAQLEAEGYTVLFAYEEAIGFMFNAVHKVGTVCACVRVSLGGGGAAAHVTLPLLRARRRSAAAPRFNFTRRGAAATARAAPNAPAAPQDKDGVSAAAAFAEMAAAYAREGRTVRQHLRDLNARYGPRAYLSGYFIADPPSKAAGVFEELRRDGKYPQVGGFAQFEWVRCTHAKLCEGVDIWQSDAPDLTPPLLPLPHPRPQSVGGVKVTGALLHLQLASSRARKHRLHSCNACFCLSVWQLFAHARAGAHACR